MKQLNKYSIANMVNQYHLQQKEVQQNDQQQSQLSQHHLKSSETDNWSQLRLPSGSLNSRSYHSISYYHNKIYIYGGYELHTGVKDDFLYFDYSSETLGTPKKVQAQNPSLSPGPLCRHTANQFKDNLIIFGGKINAMSSSNQICIFDFIEEKWSRKQPTFESQKKGEKNQVPYLESHSSSVDEKTGKIYIFGGFDIKQGHINNLYEFDIDQNIWKTIQCQQGQIPPPRSSHSSVFINGCLYIFGGQNLNQRFGDFWCFNVQNNSWTEIIKPNQPQPRSGHSICKYQDNVILFGGILGITREINDLYCFSTEKQEWSCLEYETKYDKNDLANEDFLNQLNSDDSNNNTMIQNSKQTPKMRGQGLKEDFNILGEFGLSISNQQQKTPKMRKQYSEKQLVNRKEDKNEYSLYLNKKGANTPSASISRQQQTFEDSIHRQNFDQSYESERSKNFYKKNPIQQQSERLYKLQQIRKMFNNQYLYNNSSEYNDNSIYGLNKFTSQGHTPISQQSRIENSKAVKLDTKFLMNKLSSEETPKYQERDQSYEKSNYTALINSSIQSLNIANKDQEYQLNFQSFANRIKMQSSQHLHKGQIQESLNAIFDKIKRLSMNPLISKQEKYQQITELRKKILLREFVEQNSTKKSRAATDHSSQISHSEQSSQKYINTEQNDGQQHYHHEGVQVHLPRIKSPTTDAMRKAIQMTESKAKGAANSLEQKFIQFNNSQMLQQIKQVKIENCRIKNIKPQPRDGHSAIVIDDFLIILGGDRHKLSFNDIFECNLKRALNNQQGQITSPRDRQTNQKLELELLGLMQNQQQQMSKKSQIHS